MKFKKTVFGAAAGAAVLAACGGGGGGGGSSGSTSTTSSSKAAVALVAAPGLSASGSFKATGDTTTDALGYINYQRAQVGLPALSSQAGAAQAAQNHSVWEQDNNVVGHVETAGQTGYTAATPLERVNLYYSTQSVGEITAGFSGPFTSSTEAIAGLFDAPFHRSVALFDSVHAGSGVANATSDSQLSTLTVDFADYKQFIADNQLVAWPYNGMANVNTSWFANESPNPMAQTTQSQPYENTVVGYPVTLTGGDNAAFSNVSFTIADSTGANVPCQEVDSANNSEAAREAMCVPFSPLKTSTTYTAKVTGTLSNTSLAATPFALSWSFTTAATANTPIGAPASPSSASEAKAAKQFTPRRIILN
ncbi:CAP domain-containing protein [Paraburkholderia nemoris]|uniref:CAP domain-containing protein n=1 Tax=Paraburkholderia nemoris TaxID=2793076 RepID=UPI0038B94207